MGDLSTNFSRKEFLCKCGNCGQNTVDAKLITVLERMRTYFKGAIVTVNSGNRCIAYNKKAGGRPKSFHLISQAGDVVVRGIDPHDVYKALDRMYPETLGLGDANTYTHVDVRKRHARWTY